MFLSELGGTVRYGTELVDLRHNANKVTVEMRNGAKAEYDYVVGADGVPSTTRDLLNIDFRGHDLPEIWSIADVDAEGWPNTNAFTVCQLSGGDVVVVAPLEPERFRVISNTEDALPALPLELNVTNIRRTGEFKISIRQVAQYGVDRVFLVGDAAHCHSPVGGRGHESWHCGWRRARAPHGRGWIGGLWRSPSQGRSGNHCRSEAVRKVMTSRNPLTRFLVLAVLKTASFMPALQRQFSKKILYG